MNTIVSAKREIVRLHNQIQAWFRGEAPAHGLDDLMACFAPDFRMVTIQGVPLDRDGVGDLFAQRRGASPGLAIAIRDVRLIQSTTTCSLATYREIHTAADGSETQRISVVLLSGAEGARPMWRYLQETVTPIGHRS